MAYPLRSQTLGEHLQTLLDKDDVEAVKRLIELYGFPFLENILKMHLEKKDTLLKKSYARQDRSFKA